MKPLFSVMKTQFFNPHHQVIQAPPWVLQAFFAPQGFGGCRDSAGAAEHHQGDHLASPGESFGDGQNFGIYASMRF